MVRDAVRAYWRRGPNVEPWLLLPSFWIAIWLHWALRMNLELGFWICPQGWDVVSLARYAGSWRFTDVRAALWILAGLFLLVHAVGCLFLLLPVRQDPAAWRPVAFGLTLLVVGAATIATAGVWPAPTEEEFVEGAIAYHRRWGSLDRLHFAVREDLPGGRDYCHRCLEEPDPSMRLAGAVVLELADGATDEGRRVIVEALDEVLAHGSSDGWREMDEPAVRRAAEAAGTLWWAARGRQIVGVVFARELIRGRTALIEFLDETIRPWWAENRARYAGPALR